MSILLGLFMLFSIVLLAILFFFFFNDTATTEIYTLSLHDALPISGTFEELTSLYIFAAWIFYALSVVAMFRRSEEHTSELQSRLHLVCRLLLEKKKIRSAGTPSVTKNHEAYTSCL